MSYTNLLKGRHSAAHHVYFITANLQDRSARIFSDFRAARILIKEMKAMNGRAVESLAWVVMPDHFHWLFRLESELQLGEVIRRVKGRSGANINQYLGRRGTLWQKNYYEHALRKEEDLRSTARYIVANPLRAGLVQRLGDYPHWDAVWL